MTILAGLAAVFLIVFGFLLILILQIPAIMAILAGLLILLLSLLALYDYLSGKKNNITRTDNGNGTYTILEYIDDNNKIYRHYYQSGQIISEIRYKNNKPVVKYIKHHYIDGGYLECKDNTIIQYTDSKKRNCILTPGKIIVWKACEAYNKKHTKVYVKILVPKKARRITPINTHLSRGLYKSRIEFGTVLDIIDQNGQRYDTARSYISRRNITKYTVGETVKCDKFNDDPTVECGHGIHVHKYKNHCQQWFTYRR